MERKDYYSSATKESVYFFKKETVHVCAVANLINHTHQPTLTLNNIKPDRLANGRSRQLFPQISKICTFCIFIYVFLYLDNTKPRLNSCKANGLSWQLFGKTKNNFKSRTRVARRCLVKLKLINNKRKRFVLKSGSISFSKLKYHPN